MTDPGKKPAPVRWRARTSTTLAVTAVVTAGAGGVLVGQVVTGRDPALAAIAQRQAAQQASAVGASKPARPKRTVVIRRVIVTRVVTDPATSAPAATSAQTSQPPSSVAVQRASAPVAAAPAPAPASAPAPPPVVTQGS